MAVMSVGPPRAAELAAAAAAAVDGSSLAVVRIAFGAIGVLVAVRTAANGWVDSLYAGPVHHLTYPGLDWVRPPSVPGTYVLLLAIGLGGVAVALGWRTRLALAVFVVCFGWLELIEVTTYLNHYWFVTLLGIVLFAVPSDACWSLASRRRGGPRRVPRGAIWLVRAQVGVVYAFAGLAKLNSDWLVHGLPLRIWLPTRVELPILGPMLDETWVAIGLSWAGAIFDCLAVPALLWRRTRAAAWCVVVAFHLVTAWLFPKIGVFPWLMIFASTTFFEPDWPRRVLPRVADRAVRSAPVDAPGAAHRHPRRVAVIAGLAWIAIQVAIPLRHHVIPGDYRWTNEGYRLAWTVLVTEKGGDVSFRVSEPDTGRRWRETARNLLTTSQWRVMTTEPELIRQAAHMIADEHARRGREVEVRADAFVSLNGRRAARLIDSRVDLAAEPWRLHQQWITNPEA